MAMRKTYRRTRRPVTRRTRSRVARPWTREEIQFMRKFYRNYETTWIARQLGRTVYSVRYKAVDLSIKKSSPSVWRGNRGAANAFRKPTSRSTRKPVRKPSRSRNFQSKARKTNKRWAKPRNTRRTRR